MAKQINNYEDDTGVVHKASYWLPVEININHIEKKGKITFFAYKDADARSKGDSANRKTPVGQKEYAINKTLYDAHFGVQVPKAKATNDVVDVMKVQAYALADAVYDGDMNTGYTDNGDGTYTKDSDESTVDVLEARKVFFDGASDIV